MIFWSNNKCTEKNVQSYLDSEKKNEWFVKQRQMPFTNQKLKNLDGHK